MVVERSWFDMLSKEYVKLFNEWLNLPTHQRENRCLHHEKRLALFTQIAVPSVQDFKAWRAKYCKVCEALFPKVIYCSTKTLHLCPCTVYTPNWIMRKLKKVLKENEDAKRT